MASQVKLAKGKEFTFRSVGGGGGVTKYPWDQWFDGGLWLIEEQVTDDTGKVHRNDYDVETDMMPPKLKTAARKRYKVVQVSRYDADGKKLVKSLIIRARDMTPEERQSEDIKRAEEKEALKQKKAKKTAAASNGQPTTTTLQHQPQPVA